jgi:hypothetical protein
MYVITHFEGSADEVANDTNSIKLQDAELEIHIFRMSQEADEDIAGELSGKLEFPDPSGV